MNTSEKTCFKCNCVKPLTEFYKQARMADGHLNKCKECTKSDVLQHRAENIERIREYDRKRGMLPHRVAARAEYLKTDAGRSALDRGKNKYLIEKRENRLSTTKRYYQNNKDKHKQYAKKYRDENIDKVRTIKLIAQRYRESAKNSRTPKWLTTEDKQSIRTRYAEARWMTQRSGFKHHVDHIVPLKGVFVSGMHVPWNLRVIPARENCIKGNKH